VRTRSNVTEPARGLARLRRAPGEVLPRRRLCSWGGTSLDACEPNRGHPLSQLHWDSTSGQTAGHPNDPDPVPRVLAVPGTSSRYSGRTRPGDLKGQGRCPRCASCAPLQSSKNSVRGGQLWSGSAMTSARSWPACQCVNVWFSGGAARCDSGLPSAMSVPAPERPSLRCQEVAGMKGLAGQESGGSARRVSAGRAARAARLPLGGRAEPPSRGTPSELD
jgi:hypothetical protein